MRASWSPEDSETLLRGNRPRSADAARLEPAIAALRSRAHGTADSFAVAAMASRLAKASLEPVAAGRVRAPRPVAAQPAAPWRRRVSIAGVVAILASAGLAGTAAAADGAAPGDTLYGVDRALEAVGIDDGGAGERLVEAGKLAGNGDVEGALRHAADALRASGDSASSEALLAAADRIVSSGGGDSADVRAKVAQMLVWMTTADVTGKDFGKTVSSYAQNMGGPQGNVGDDASAPGKSGDAASTNGHGNSGSDDKSGNQGHQGDQGKPGDPGKPDPTDKSVVTPPGSSGAHPGNGSGG